MKQEDTMVTPSKMTAAFLTAAPTFFPIMQATSETFYEQVVRVSREALGAAERTQQTLMISQGMGVERTVGVPNSPEEALAYFLARRISRQLGRAVYLICNNREAS